MNIKPLGNRILLRLKKAETKTAGGIYIPEEVSNEKKQGEVVSIGDGKDISGLKEGDTVMYDSYGGSEFENGDDKYLVVDFKDIIAKLE